MIDASKLGKRIAEAIANEPGPCFYPGKFKPPHVGHFEAAKELASKDYVKQVNVVISRKTIDGITAEDSLMIWHMYLQAEPNPKITVKISSDESPIQSIMKYLKNNPTVNTVYVAVGDDEVDDEAYGQSLQQDFGDRVKVIPVHEKAGDITAPHVRGLLAAGDFEGFKEAVPEAAYNRGAAPRIFKMLATKVKGDGQEQA